MYKERYNNFSCEFCYVGQSASRLLQIINRKSNNVVTICWQTSWSNFFSVVVFLLSSLVTGPSFISLSLLVLELWQFLSIRDWSEIRKSGNAPVWAFPNIWRLGWIWDFKFGRNVSNEMLLNAAKYQGYSVYRFGVTKGKLTGRVKLLSRPRTQIRVKLRRICLPAHFLGHGESMRGRLPIYLNIYFT